MRKYSHHRSHFLSRKETKIMGEYDMETFKHFLLEERITIQNGLNSCKSFKAIANQLGKAPSSISREVRRHIEQKASGGYGRQFNDCINRSSCTLENVCQGAFQCSRKLCRNCKKCKDFCSAYSKEICQRLTKTPYVCNGCEERLKCTLEKSLYKAVTAEEEAKLLLCESRSGISLDEDEIQRLDAIVTPLVLQGQSIHHICCSNKDSIMSSERTIYNYVNDRVLTAKNIDLPRKVRYRPRKKAKTRFKVDKTCVFGRNYNDFLAFMKNMEDAAVVQMDTVEGRKGGKVLLTLSFVNSSFMWAYLRDANTSKSVTDIFQMLWEVLGKKYFMELFPVILTDNGSEFSNPVAIEFDEENKRRTNLFYCHPSSPFEKGSIENNHEFLRRILPKGTSFDQLKQEKDIQLMLNHINSYQRKKLNNKSPYETFAFLHGEEILRRLGAEFISPQDIILKPELLRV
jgi:IS30 family transposase